jgi:hypothetical protein
MKQNSSNLNTAIELRHENVHETENRLKQTVKELNLIVWMKTNFRHNLFLVYINIYMFRASLAPSSAGTTVWMQQLYQL